MKLINRDAIFRNSAQTIGFDASSHSLESTAFLASCLRSAAGFYCPSSEKSLILSATTALSPLITTPELKAQLSDVLEMLIAHGDLVELDSNDGENRAKLLYIASPSFVRINDKAVFLLGVAPDNRCPLPESLSKKMQYRDHIRILECDDSTADQLRGLGLFEIKINSWMKCPKEEPAASLVEKMNSAVENSPPVGEIKDLRILNPRKVPNYYSGRWEPPTSHSGFFIARRPQAYGADLWCYIKLSNGMPKKMLDLPLRSSNLRGCDEAWRLQAAIDSINGTPQVFSMENEGEDKKLLKLYSPVPMWAQRRLGILGTRVNPKNCLFGLSFSCDDILSEVDFLKRHLWMVSV